MIKVIKGYQREMRWLLNLRLEKNTSWLIFCKGHLETTDLGWQLEWVYLLLLYELKPFK